MPGVPPTLRLGQDLVRSRLDRYWSGRQVRRARSGLVAATGRRGRGGACRIRLEAGVRARTPTGADRASAALVVAHHRGPGRSTRLRTTPRLAPRRAAAPAVLSRLRLHPRYGPAAHEPTPQDLQRAHPHLVDFRLDALAGRAGFAVAGVATESPHPTPRRDPPDQPHPPRHSDPASRAATPRRQSQ